MKKVKILLLFLFTFTTLQTFAINQPTDDSKDKVTLSFLILQDEALQFVASDINSMILRKNKGFLWPATKVVFSKDGDRLLFNVMAIDNSWCNMFQEGEKPYGYFVESGRVFIVSVKGDSPVEVEKYFERDPNELQRTFYKPSAETKPVSKNPVWSYLHKGHMATVLNSVYMESLGR
ncbi:MAG: hypothetical protein E6767_00730 [Dysgonomonas sp.]|nr:hypothetical protein [Dysgonomonas sp.]